MSVDRRRLLQILGIGSTSFFLPSLLTPRGQGLRAADATTPTRLLIIGTKHGTKRDHWLMKPPSGAAPPDSQDWQFDVTQAGVQPSTVLAPLFDRGLAPNLLLLDGLGYITYLVDNGDGNEHVKGHVTRITGGTTAGNSAGGSQKSSHPSLDQLLAPKMKAAGGVNSLNLASTTGEGETTLCFGSNGEQIKGGQSAVQARKTLLGDTPVASSEATPPPVAVEDTEQKALLQQVNDEYKAFLTTNGARLGKADTQKLDAHRSLVNDMLSSSRGTMRARANCTEAPDVNDDGNRIELVRKNMLPIIKTAFACDLTRVATISLADPPYGQAVEVPGSPKPPGDVHNDFFHNEDKGGADAAQASIDFHTLHAGLVADIAKSFKDTADGTGSLLDSTIILWIPEVGTGGHDMSRLPIVVIGNARNHFRTGRYLHYASSHREANPSWKGGEYGPPHNQLLVSIAQALGFADINSVGLANASLPNGDVSLSGPLRFLQG